MIGKVVLGTGNGNGIGIYLPYWYLWTRVKNEGGLDQIEVQWLDNAFLGTGTYVWQ